jgi:hypothetical protein
MNTGSYSEQLRERVDLLPKGAVFVAKDFADITDAQTVRRIINLMIEQGSLGRVIPGVYYRPRESALLNKSVPVDPNEVAQAIARANGWIITPSGETALNRIGLSTQVPATWTYLSDGPYRDYSFNGTSLRFKRTTGRNLKGLSLTSRMVVQALKALGKHQITQDVIDYLTGRLSAIEKQKLMDETPMITEWIRIVIVRVCREVQE